MSNPEPLREEIKAQVNEFVGCLSPGQFLTFTLYFGINPEGIHLNQTEIAKALKTRDSTIQGNLELISKKLQLYPKIIQELRKSRA